MSDLSDSPAVFVGLPWGGRGVAEFADARFAQVFRRQLPFAVVAAACICLGLQRTWFPVIREAIGQLPAKAEIRDARLVWPAPTARSLADNGFLAIAVEPVARGVLSRSADFQFTFRQASLQAEGLFGTVEIPYPSGWVIVFDRLTLASWWDAWSWVMLLGIGGAATLLVMMMWWMLAAFYAFPVRVLGFLFRRPLGYAGASRLAAGALLTGSVPMSLGFVAYALHTIRLPGLLIMTGLHFVVGWLWLAWGTIAWLFTHRKDANPFKTSSQREEKSGKKKRRGNPFGK